MKKLNTEEFIKKCLLKHGNKYDYRLVKYINSRTPVDIICKKHGIFTTNPKNHYNGSNCPVCANDKISKQFSFTSEEFIEKAVKIHGDKYDYSLVEYKRSHNYIKIICKKHGIFSQISGNHLSGHGCDICAKEKIGKQFSDTVKQFIEKAIMVHGDKYDYSHVDYVNCMSKINIICNIHGGFKQTPNSHLRGQGCPICKESRGEKKIREYLLKNKIKFNRQKKFIGCKNTLKLPFDFYLPDKKILIEYDGKQHFIPVDAFGGEEGYKKLKENDNIKNNFVFNSKYELIRICYKDYNNIENILNKFLHNDNAIQT